MGGGFLLPAWPGSRRTQEPRCSQLQAQGSAQAGVGCVERSRGPGAAEAEAGKCLAGILRGRSDLLQIWVPVSFADVSVTFTQEEWEILAEWQKELYWEVMRENYEILISLGDDMPKPALLLLPEEGGTPGTEDASAREVLAPVSREIPRPEGTTGTIQSALPCDTGQRPAPKEFRLDRLEKTSRLDLKIASDGESTMMLGAEGPRASGEVKQEDNEVEIQIPAHLPLSVEGRPVPWGSESSASPLGAPLHTAPEAALTVLAKCKTEPFREAEVPLQCPSRCEGRLRWRRQADGAAPREARCLVKEEIEDGSYGTGFRAQQYQSTPREEAEAPPGTEYDESYSPWLGPADRQRTHVGADPSRGSEDVVICKTEIMDDLQVHVVEEPYPAESPAGERPGEQLLRCSKCDRHFLRPSDLLRHCRVHGGERPYRCNRCGKGFRRRSHLNEHLRTHTGEKPFPCSLCPKSFTRRSTLNKHQETHAKERLRRHAQRPRESAWQNDPPKPGQARKACPSGRGHATFSTLGPTAHAGEKPFSCGVCGRGFSMRSYATKHERAHLEERPSPCAPGPEAQQGPSGEKPFPCGLCGRWFRRRSHLSDHLRTHTGEKPFPCSLCPKSFTRRSTLNKHQETHGRPGLHAARGREPLRKRPRLSPPAAQPYPCRGCHKSFSTRAYALRHERAHTGERPGLNGTGDRSLGRQTRSVRHETGPGREAPRRPQGRGNGGWSQPLTFKEERPFPGASVLGRAPEHPPAPARDKLYACSLCEKSFRWPSTLRKHQSSHVAETLHSCPFCPQSFRSPLALQKHQLSHLEEKPFACGLCHKRFRRRAYLGVHRRVHPEHGPYHCALCETRFVFKCDFVKHHGFHTGERPYPCSRCARSFRKQSHLTEHLRIHTGEKPFPCQVCGKRFGRRSTLTKHQQIHARRAPLRGADCPKTCALESGFVLPQKTHGKAAAPSV